MSRSASPREDSARGDESCGDLKAGSRLSHARSFKRNETDRRPSLAPG